MNSKSLCALAGALGLALFTTFAAAEDAAAGGGLSYDDKLKACGACHGDNGDKPLAPDYPKLAGQHADYLTQALKNYRDGRRTHPIMSMQVKALNLTDEDMVKLGQHFAGLPPAVQTLTK